MVSAFVTIQRRLNLTYFWSRCYRFKGLTSEERVYCLTTIDKEICDTVRKTMVERQRIHEAANFSAQHGLDKLQSLLFVMIPPDVNWEVQINDLTNQ